MVLIKVRKYYFNDLRRYELSDETSENSYPGDNASIKDILDLADAYYAAAQALFEAAKKGKPLSYAPARLCSIHAVELFLNAFLRSRGATTGQIRGRMHNLADLDFVNTLKLRKKTAEHLQSMTEKREYLISRYGPEVSDQHSELNRLTATLDEVMNKVTKYLSPEM